MPIGLYAFLSELWVDIEGLHFLKYLGLDGHFVVADN